MWAILIQGAYGNGKSFMQKLMSTVLGYENVNTIDASVMNSDYNGYAEGSQLVFVEEMMLYDRKESAVMGRLKTMVANEDITVTEKYVKAKPIPNVTNYIMFTNDKGAIQINDGDRRYYITCTQQQSKQDVLEQMPQEYFNELFTVFAYPEALRKYFLEYPIRESFSPKYRAPDSEDKELFVQHSKNDLQLAVEDALEDLAQSEVVSSTDLFHILSTDIDSRWGDLRISPVKLQRSLIKIGYFPAYPKGARSRVNGKKHSLWIAPGASALARQNPKKYFAEVVTDL